MVDIVPWRNSSAAWLSESSAMPHGGFTYVRDMAPIKEVRAAFK